MKLYKSCETLPVFNFYKIANKGNLKYLVYDYDEENSDLELENQDELNDIWRNILYEYYELRNDKSMLIKVQKKIKIETLRTEIEIIQSLILLYIRKRDNKVKELLLKYKIKIDLSGDIEKEIERLKNKLNGLKTRLKIQEIAFNKQYNKKTVENNNLINDIIASLDLNYDLDTKKTSVAKWVALIKNKNKKANGSKN
jgi:hypothetical protein